MPSLQHDTGCHLQFSSPTPLIAAVSGFGRLGQMLLHLPTKLSAHLCRNTE